jgi:hypothetical protein
MMTHYGCKGGCGGTSDKPGTCQSETCKDKGKDLRSCACEDGTHQGSDWADADVADA